MWHLYVKNPEEKSLWRSDHPDLDLYHVQQISVPPRKNIAETKISRDWAKVVETETLSRVCKDMVAGMSRKLCTPGVQNGQGSGALPKLFRWKDLKKQQLWLEPI
jgi:hypothetical protein